MVSFNNVLVVPVCSSDDCSSVVAQCLQWYWAIVARNKESFPLVPVIPYKVSFMVVVPIAAVTSKDLLGPCFVSVVGAIIAIMPFCVCFSCSC